MLRVSVKKRFVRKPGLRSPQADHAGTCDAFELDVNFNAPPGFTVLFGPSGSGKTTTLKIVSGLIAPDFGRIEVPGRTLFDSEKGVDLPARERGAGYVFQNLALFPHLSAIENVRFAISQTLRMDSCERALALLEQFKVGHAAYRLPRNISGGEAQRVALARALAASPRMLLLDEPLSALDEPTKLGVIEDLKSANRELRLPVLYVTHSRDEAFALGERVLVFERGRIVGEGSPVEIFHTPARMSVARLTGTENIFKSLVLMRDEEAETMRLQVEDDWGGVCVVEAPLANAKEGDVIHIAVPSGDIMISTEEPRGLSARNVLAGEIVSVEEKSEGVLVRVKSGVGWLVSVTRRSSSEMSLEAGRRVWLVFKTYSCRVIEE